MFKILSILKTPGIFYFAVFLSLACGFASASIADDSGMTKFRNYTPKQVAEMSEKMRSESMPIAYIFAAKTGLAADSELLFGMQLTQLMYPGINDYSAAVRAFQRDLKDPANGVLTVGQIHQLDFRSNFQKAKRVFFPEGFQSLKTENFGSVQGALTILDDQIAWPINHQKVVCWKSANQCAVNQLVLETPREAGFRQNYLVMAMDTDYYNITRWADDLIEATYVGQDNACRTTSLSFNFKIKEFFFFTKNATSSCEVSGLKMENLRKPRVSQIVDGRKIFDEEFSKIERLAYEFLASDFRKKVESFDARKEKTR